MGLAAGFGVLWVARSGEPRPPEPAVPAEAAAGPTIERPVGPPRPSPKFPASLDMFVDANKRSRAVVSDGMGDEAPRVREGGVAGVTPVRSPAAEAAAEAELARSDAPEERVYGEPDPLHNPPPEPKGSLLLSLRVAGASALALVVGGWAAGLGRSGRALSAAAATIAVLTGVLGLAARSKGAGGEPAAWLGLAAFAAIVSLSRLRGATPSDPTAS